MVRDRLRCSGINWPLFMKDSGAQSVNSQRTPIVVLWVSCILLSPTASILPCHPSLCWIAPSTSRAFELSSFFSPYSSFHRALPSSRTPQHNNNHKAAVASFSRRSCWW